MRDTGYQLIVCVECGNCIGFVYKNKVKNNSNDNAIDKDIDNNNNNIPSMITSVYFFVNKIIIKNEKKLKIALCGLKLEKLLEIEKTFNKLIHDESKYITGNKTKPEIIITVLKQV
jgi:hypothetical protein